MITTAEQGNLEHIHDDTDRKLAEALVDLQNREEMRFCRNQEILNGVKSQYQAKEKEKGF